MITVAYNSAATIERTLVSVDIQKEVDFEHIVIDGASTDGTSAFIARHQSPRRRTLCERDGGIYDAMNKGLRLADGDIVGFLNADDVFAHDRVLHDIAAAVEGDTANVVYGDLQYVRAGDPSRVVRRWRSGEFSRERLRFGWMPPHPTFYATRSLLDRVGGFNLKFRIAGDYDFMMRTLLRTDCHTTYLPKILVNMSVGGESNRSLSALRRKSREDLEIIRSLGIGGWGTLMCKNIRKFTQFVRLT